MLLLVLGAVLVLFGLFAGAVLVLVPLGLVPWTADWVLWLLFPSFSITGYVLFVMGARAAPARQLGWVLSALLLLLALASAGALLLSAASVLQLAGGSLSLWYVLVVAGSLGITGAAAHQRRGDDEP